MDPNLIVWGLAGALLGWVVRDILGRKRLDPNVLRAASEQIEAVRQDLHTQLVRQEEAREKDRVAFGELLENQAARVDYWMQKAQSPRRRAVKTEENGAMPEKVDVQSAYQLATEGPSSKQGELRDELLSKGLTPEEVDAILSGNYEDLPPGDRTDLFVTESMREATGLQ